MDSIKGHITEIIMSNKCDKSVEVLAEGMDTPLSISKQSDLSVDLIKDIWAGLIKREGIRDDESVQDLGRHYIFKG